MEQNVEQLPFVDRAWAWFETNWRQALWGAGIVVVAGSGVGFYLWHEDQKLVKAGEALSKVEALAAMPGGSHNVTADAYLKVAAEHPGTRAGARALLEAAAALFTQGKYAEAQTQFQKFSHDYPDSPFRGQAMLGVAACLDALAKPDEAAAAYKQLVDQHPGEACVPQAKFALARIYESQGKLQQALPLYEELAHTDAYGSIGNEAGFKADELRAKMPAPALTPAPVTTTPPTATPPPAASAPTTTTPIPLLSTQPSQTTNKP